MPFTLGGDWISSEKPEPKKPIKVYLIKRKGKTLTAIKHIPPSHIKQTSQALKTKFATGGSIKDNEIQLQGDHLTAVKAFLKTVKFD